MDTPIEKAIERYEKHLKQLKDKNPEAVFKCPQCGKYFEQLGNYRELRMCGGCYQRTNTQELKDRVKHLIGGTILDIQVEEANPLWVSDTKKPIIKQITVRAKDGKDIKLNKEKEVHYLL